ncbi:hypothetical protein RM549_06595 [Salegentibacter sp. F188]|uniref:Carboxypeptidase-like regulatory domain-containing protein n=1 Tax=Autumnicola patrickiae TaxID=3075591 RepID=A0ABU3E0E7_9FLAO|nr:hypothetical protein [Salegentibacter sp. F188]MDT0689446.1 hypothetical protein [Salegentibacter sp. F188]
MLKYLFVLILFIPFLCSAQERIQLKGKITNDSLDGSYINIINKTSNIGTINSSSGEFQIQVREKDTLEFSSIQYEKLEVVVTPLLMEAGYLRVLLVPGISELDEVKISNIDLTGDLSRDIGNMNTFSISQFGIPNANRKALSAAERRLHAATTTSVSTSVSGGGAGGAVGLDPLINAITGRTKKLKKVVANEKLQQMVEKGVAAFSTRFFVEELKIPEDKIINFVYYCAENHQLKYLLKDENRLDLLEFYIKYAPEFLDGKGPE